MSSEHEYTAHIAWTGKRGAGTRGYRGYDRTWDIATPGKPVIHCSNDPLLGGDPALPNPEDLLLASLSACHMLWYLHLASEAGIAVISYQDDPIGIGESTQDGAGRFVRATLPADRRTGWDRHATRRCDPCRDSPRLLHRAVGEFPRVV